MARTRRLFEPLRLDGITLANRIAVSPMRQYSAENGAANDWRLQHLGSLPLSGAGLVIVEQTAVEPVGRISHGCLGLYSDAFLARSFTTVSLQFIDVEVCWTHRWREKDSNPRSPCLRDCD